MRRCGFRVSLRKNTHFNDSIDQFDLAFGERETTLKFLMNPSIQLQLAVLSLSMNIFIIGMFGVERERATVHNWIRKAEFRPKEPQSGLRCSRRERGPTRRRAILAVRRPQKSLISDGCTRTPFL